MKDRRSCEIRIVFRPLTFQRATNSDGSSDITASEGNEISLNKSMERVLGRTTTEILNQA